MEKPKKIPALDVKKVRSKSESEERWENSSHREPDEPLSFEERRTYKTSEKTQGELCFGRYNVIDEEKYRALYSDRFMWMM